MPTFTFEDKKVFWSEEGSGAPILLVHGFCEDSRMYASFLPFLADAGFRAIAPDLLGFGQSDIHPKADLLTQAAMLEKLVAHLQIKSPVIIGHSMGGYIALECLKRRKINWLGLGLFHSHPYADPPATREKRQKSIAFIERNGLSPYLKDFFPQLFPPAFAKENPHIIQQLTTWAKDYHPVGVQTALKAMHDRKDQQVTLQKSPVPILFLLGQEDPLLPHEMLVDQTHLPQIADIQIMQGIGHMGAFEAPAHCVRCIAQFAQFCAYNNHSGI